MGMKYELTPEEMAIIDTFREGKTAQRRRKAMDEIAEICAPNYWHPENLRVGCYERIWLSLVRHGFNPPSFDRIMMETVCSGNEGRINYDCAGCYLAITWYLMPSSNWEIVAYIS